MLYKYQAELAKPLKEAMDFFTGVELQLDSLINGEFVYESIYFVGPSCTRV